MATNIMTYNFALKSLCLLALLLFASTTFAAPIIWNGPPVTFTKEGFADVTEPENQDRITDNVWITRGSSQGLFNAATESSYAANLSPAGTLWALGTTAESDSLTYTSWEELVGRSSSIGGPVNMLGLDMVVHLVTDDIYLDLRFTEWGGQPQGGSFTYVRSTPSVVPEPSSLAMVAGALIAVVGWRCRAR